MRRRITSTPDRMLPPVRAHLMLEIVPQLADVEEMLFAEQESHERRRSMARAIDRIASFLDVPPFTLALEIERLRIFELKAKPEHIAGSSKVMGNGSSAKTPAGEDEMEPSRGEPVSS
jgi:hypothetical protein